MSTTTYAVESFGLDCDTIGQTFHIDVSLPAGYADDPEREWPLAYVLDGNLMFHYAAMTAGLCARDVLDRGVEPAIVVGIGYPDASEASILRVRDFTPPDCLDDWFADVYVWLAGRRAEGGRAPDLLAFLQDQLDPEIRRRYRVRGDAAALFGDSYGGLFAYYALIENAATFDRYWLGSPGIFGAAARLLPALADRLTAGFEREMRVCMTLGSIERHGSVGGSLPHEMYQEMAASYDTLDAAFGDCRDPNLVYDAREFDGESHVSVVGPALMHAWRFLMRGG